jgi:hypothetical protein
VKYATALPNMNCRFTRKETIMRDYQSLSCEIGYCCFNMEIIEIAQTVHTAPWE